MFSKNSNFNKYINLFGLYLFLRETIIEIKTKLN